MPAARVADPPPTPTLPRESHHLADGREVTPGVHVCTLGTPRIEITSRLALVTLADNILDAPHTFAPATLRPLPLHNRILNHHDLDALISLRDEAFTRFRATEVASFRDRLLDTRKLIDLIAKDLDAFAEETSAAPVDSSSELIDALSGLPFPLGTTLRIYNSEIVVSCPTLEFPSLGVRLGPCDYSLNTAVEYRGGVNHPLHHPHLGGGAEFCEGDFADAWSEAREDEDFFAAFNILREIFIKYNTNSPYFRPTDLHFRRPTQALTSTPCRIDALLGVRGGNLAITRVPSFHQIGAPHWAYITTHEHAWGLHTLIKDPDALEPVPLGTLLDRFGYRSSFADYCVRHRSHAGYPHTSQMTALFARELYVPEDVTESEIYEALFANPHSLTLSSRASCNYMQANRGFHLPAEDADRLRRAVVIFDRNQAAEGTLQALDIIDARVALPPTQVRPSPLKAGTTKEEAAARVASFRGLAATHAPELLADHQEDHPQEDLPPAPRPRVRTRRTPASADLSEALRYAIDTATVDPAFETDDDDDDDEELLDAYLPPIGPRPRNPTPMDGGIVRPTTPVSELVDDPEQPIRRP